MEQKREIKKYQIDFLCDDCKLPCEYMKSSLVSSYYYVHEVKCMKCERVYELSRRYPYTVEEVVEIL